MIRSSLARKRDCGRAMARAMIDGAAMRVVLDQYRSGAIGAEVARRRFLAAGIAGKAADAMIKAFAPRPPASGATS